MRSLFQPSHIELTFGANSNSPGSQTDEMAVACWLSSQRGPHCYSVDWSSDDVGPCGLEDARTDGKRERENRPTPARRAACRAVAGAAGHGVFLGRCFSKGRRVAREGTANRECGAAAPRRLRG